MTRKSLKVDDVALIHLLRQRGIGWRGIDAALGHKAPGSKSRGRRMTGFRAFDLHRKQCGCSA